MEGGVWRKEGGCWRTEDKGWSVEDGGWRAEGGAVSLPVRFYQLHSGLRLGGHNSPTTLAT